VLIAVLVVLPDPPLSFIVSSFIVSSFIVSSLL